MGKTSLKWIVLYTITSFLSIICSGLVISAVSKRVNFLEKMVFLLHVTLIGIDLSLFPVIFTYNEAVCQLMAFVQYYCLYAHILVIFFLSLEYYRVFHDSEWLKYWIRNYATTTIFSIPLLYLFFFITDDYKQLDDAFCYISTDDRSGNAWLYILVVPTICAVTVASTLIVLRVVGGIRRDPVLRVAFAAPANMVILCYLVVTLLGIAPRFIDRAVMLINPGMPETANSLLPEIYPTLLIGIGDFLFSYIHFPKFRRPESNRSSSLSLFGAEDLEDHPQPQPRVVNNSLEEALILETLPNDSDHLLLKK